MVHPLKKELPLLWSVINNMESKHIANGLCFHRSVALILEIPVAAELCMGVLRAATEEERKTIPDASPEPFIHCWVEYGGNVIAPTTYEAFGGKILPMERISYYTKNGIVEGTVHRLPRPIVKKLARKYNVVQHLRSLKPLSNGAKFASIFLDAANIPYRINERGGIIPLKEPSYE